MLFLLLPAFTTSPAEICDGLDNDGDGVADDDVPLVALWPDQDGDTFGDLFGAQVNGCEAEDGNTGFYVQEPGEDPRLELTGYVPNNGDCNDFSGAISPDDPEVCDELDNDCSGIIDDSQDGDLWSVDGDGDGYGAGEGEWGCSQPTPESVTVGGDCDDLDAGVNPGADEVAANEIDDDCDGAVDDVVAGPDPGGEDGDDKDGGCGCRGTGTAAAGLAALPIVLFGRRRRVTRR